MKDFIAIDFETANPQRVSACAFGFARVQGSQIVDSAVFLIKPVGGHAPFQSKIHGIKEEHTFDKPEFGDLFPQFKSILSEPIVAHSQFDLQVLKALSAHFGLGLRNFNYTDSSEVARAKVPGVKNYKLKTLVKHFKLPEFKHHDAKEDAIACASIFLKIMADVAATFSVIAESENATLQRLCQSILEDEFVDYKEAYQLLYWLADHPIMRDAHKDLFSKLRMCLEDDRLTKLEATELKEELLNLTIPS